MSHQSLTPAQAERLEMLIEEASEVIQTAAKILRHGYTSYHPDSLGETNSQALEREILDFTSVVSAMGHAFDFAWSDREGFFSEASTHRWEKKLRWTHHQGHKP